MLDIKERLELYSMPEPNSGCRLWLKCYSTTGYGKISYRGRSEKAHRVAWKVEHGDIPDEVDVLHRCDVCGCIELSHLFLGDQQANMADKVAKGRHPRGPASARAAFTAEEVVAIRADTRAQRAIAMDYGVTQSTISDIKTRRRYASV